MAAVGVGATDGGVCCVRGWRAGGAAAAATCRALWRRPTAGAHALPSYVPCFPRLTHPQIDDAYGDDSGMKGLSLRDAKTGAPTGGRAQPAQLLQPAARPVLRWRTPGGAGSQAPPVAPTPHRVLAPLTLPALLPPPQARSATCRCAACSTASATPPTRVRRAAGGGGAGWRCAASASPAGWARGPAAPADSGRGLRPRHRLLPRALHVLLARPLLPAAHRRPPPVCGHTTPACPALGPAPQASLPARWSWMRRATSRCTTAAAPTWRESSLRVRCAGGAGCAGGRVLVPACRSWSHALLVRLCRDPFPPLHCPPSKPTARPHTPPHHPSRRPSRHRVAAGHHGRGVGLPGRAGGRALPVGQRPGGGVCAGGAR